MRSRFKKIYTIGASLAILSMGSVALVSGSANAAAKAPKCNAPSTVTIGGFPAGTTVATDIADGLGYFNTVAKECHTTINFSYLTAPSPLSAGLVAGQFQYIVVGGTGQIIATEAGQPITNLVTLAQGGLGNLVSSKNNAPTVPAGLAAFKQYPSNSSWGVTSLNSLSTLDIDLLLHATGGDPSQASYVPLGSAGIAPAVAAGTVKLGNTVPATTGPLILSGQVVEVLNTSGIEAYKSVGYIPGWNVEATPATVKKYPELSKLVVEAELKALFFIQKNTKTPQAVYNAELPAFTSVTTEAAFASSWGWIASTYTATGLITRPALLKEGSEMAGYGEVPGGFNAAQFPQNSVDIKLLKAAFKDLKHPFPKAGDFVNLKILATLPE